VSHPLSNIKCFLLDMDGTFYLGNQLLDGALHFIDILREQNRDFLFLTNNSSKNRCEYAEKITKLGLELSEDKVFTSGEATAIFLKQNYPSNKIFLLGTPSLEEEFKGYGFNLVAENPDLIVIGFDTTLTYQKMWKLCNFVRSGLPYIATHLDFNCPIDGGFMPDIGAIIAFVKTSTGREPDHVIGKPNRMIIDAISAKLGLSIQELAMVGDRLYTDIALGHTSGIITILVLSGESRLVDLENSPFKPNYVFQNLGELAEQLELFEE